MLVSNVCSIPGTVPLCFAALYMLTSVQGVSYVMQEQANRNTHPQTHMQQYATVIISTFVALHTHSKVIKTLHAHTSNTTQATTHPLTGNKGLALTHKLMQTYTWKYYRLAPSCQVSELSHWTLGPTTSCLHVPVQFGCFECIQQTLVPIHPRICGGAGGTAILLPIM